MKTFGYFAIVLLLATGLGCKDSSSVPKPTVTPSKTPVGGVPVTGDSVVTPSTAVVGGTSKFSISFQSTSPINAGTLEVTRNLPVTVNITIGGVVNQADMGISVGVGLVNFPDGGSLTNLKTQNPIFSWTPNVNSPAVSSLQIFVRDMVACQAASGGVAATCSIPETKTIANPAYDYTQTLNITIKDGGVGTNGILPGSNGSGIASILAGLPGGLSSITGGNSTGTGTGGGFDFSSIIAMVLGGSNGGTAPGTAGTGTTP